MHDYSFLFSLFQISQIRENYSLSNHQQLNSQYQQQISVKISDSQNLQMKYYYQKSSVVTVNYQQILAKFNTEITV